VIKVAVAGAKGRMGSLIANLILKDSDFELVGVTEKPNSDAIGKEFCPGVKFSPSLKGISKKPQVLIDFTTLKATLYNLKEAEDLGVSMVIGTTGFSEGEVEEIRKASQKIPIVFSPNMSLGVNLLFKLVAEVAKALKGKDYDAEIFEIHHRFKKDAPSGTALRLAEIVAKEMGRNLSEVAVYGRKGQVGERKPEEIGILSSRMGDVVGEHTVYFATLGERLELTHRASSRETFARGALVAAKWVVGKEPGLYTMFDVLGI